ncbi:MAG: DUF4270 family protein [Cyclobacteriaceae bacterium]
MTLLDKICRSLVPLGLVIGLLSCEDPSEVGLSLNTDGTQIGVFYEELVLPATNYFIDSLRTSASPRLLVGKYADPTFGTTNSTAVTQVGLNRFTYIVRDTTRDDSDVHIEDYVLDSAVLQLRLNYYHSDNVGQPQTIKVAQISDTLFTGVSYFARFPTPVDELSTVYGEETVIVNPQVDSIVRIQVPIFGENSLGFMRTKKLGVISGDSLLNHLKGIALIPGDNNSAIMGFDPNSAETKLGVYYHVKHVAKDSVVEDSLSIVYNLAALSEANTIRYNSIQTDRSGSAMSIVPESLNSFDLNDGNVYLQSGTGIYPSVDLTPFKEFLDRTGNLIINRTDIELSLSSDAGNSEFISNVGGSRFFFLREGANITNASRSVILTNASYLSSSANTSAIAELDENDMTYKVETTLFSQLLNNQEVDPDNLLLVPSDITTMNQGIFDKEGVKLKIYYTIPK